MITCTVHERDNGGPDIEARSDRVVFVREGIAWLAIPFPVLWLLYHRMWLVLACFVILLAGVSAAATAFELPDLVSGLITLGLSVLLALEGNDLRRWTLARRGYAQVDVTVGRDREECERRFFDGWLEKQGTPAGNMPVRTSPAGPSGPRRSGGGGDEVIGLFPEAGR